VLDGGTDPPRVLGGRYRIDALAGRGGMGDVYRAFDLRLERPVAVKVRAKGPEEDEARFFAEARTLAALSHPNLVAALDAGVHDDCVFLVMELVDGPTLAARLRHGPLSPGEAAAVGCDVAAALGYVHRRGVVQRDVKPANVLLEASGRARLADFGVAWLADRPRTGTTGVALGTPAYLAPEQVSGGPVGPPADVYALGLVLLEALTGVRAFPGAAQEAALARLVRDPEVPAGLAPAWRALLVAATARDPASRPEAEALRRQLSSLATSVATASAPRRVVIARPRARRTLRGRRRALLLGGAAAALVAALGASSAVGGTSVRRGGAPRGAPASAGRTVGAATVSPRGGARTPGAAAPLAGTGPGAPALPPGLERRGKPLPPGHGGPRPGGYGRGPRGRGAAARVPDS